MSSVYENNIITGLPGWTNTGFRPMSSRRSSPKGSAPMRFHPFDGYRLACQRTAYGANSGPNNLPMYGTGNYVASASESLERCLPGNGVYLANALYHQYMLPFSAGTQEAGYQHAFNIKTLQNLCVPAAETRTSFPASSSIVRKERSHPFHCRKRVEPVEGMTRTRDKYRVVYTEKQRKGLEKEYNTNKFITSERRTELCGELSLSERQIKIWFQNRRAKERRDSKKDKDIDETDSDNTSTDDNNIDGTCARNLVDAKFSTSCRFAGNNAQFNERPISSRQCRFINQSESDSIDGNMSTPLNACFFESRESGTMGHSVSPSEWRPLAETNYFPSLDVSPLTGNFNVGFELRL